MIGNPYTQDEVSCRVSAFWNLSTGFPIARKRILCPVCRSKDVIQRNWTFFKRGGPSPNPHRCDVRFKCTVCSMVWAHGVPISREVFVKMVEGKNRKSYSWRKVKCLLEKQKV